MIEPSTSYYICKMKWSTLIFSTLLTITTLSCKQQPQEKPLTASQIVDKALQAHGSKLASEAQVDFDFRETHYMVSRKKGQFVYSRAFVHEDTPILDYWTNKRFTRFEDGAATQLPDSMVTKYRNSLNSVIYFAQLPYSLDGPAVYKKLLGEQELKGKKYYKIEVTFDPNGGGEDHDDVFIYWINKQDFMVDYLAYSYCELDCGFRFRESVNRKNIKGITLQDYNNYKSPLANTVLEQMDLLFKNGKLELLSQIKLENPAVELYK